ncbi:hypothetical protein DXG01_008825 [Tephrocybe rancida]|nr:hypothetical protein DXG01_008825 [Tephrocybe rancida]
MATWAYIAATLAPVVYLQHPYRMVPAPISARNAHPHTTKLLYTLLSIASQHVSRFVRGADAHTTRVVLAKRDEGFDPHSLRDRAFAALIPILVLLSGLFAGLTLGYMSLDETQLSVLSISGTPKQREYANKIKPIRKNGHLLLVTLLLANMIVNETLPVIAEPVLGGGLLGVIVSTVLIIIFAEIIPQSLFSRHGLYLGAKMATLTRCLIVLMAVIAWPVAKLLEWVLGPHHGIIYRRAELKELIALHSSNSPLGGDLKIDTVTIIGATLDLQEKVVKQLKAMTPIEDVFMLSIESKLDYELLKKIVQTGHSRVPVYEEVEVPISTSGALSKRTQKMKKILGILLVKQCVMLDPKDATPLRKIPLNKVPFVPNNEPLLGILDKFQEGRSHMAIAISVKKAAKRGLTQRLRERVGMGDSDSSDEEKDAESSGRLSGVKEAEEATLRGDGVVEQDFGTQGQSVFISKLKPSRGRSRNVQMRDTTEDHEKEKVEVEVEEAMDGTKRSARSSFQLPRAAANMASMSALEQSMPADAVLGKQGAEEFLKNFDAAVMPLGIITLEDVLEGKEALYLLPSNSMLTKTQIELIGEEIYDEFDPQGARGDPYQVPPKTEPTPTVTMPEPAHTALSKPPPSIPLYMPTALKSLGGLGFLRSRSAPPVPRDPDHDDEKLPPLPVPVPVPALPNLTPKVDVQEAPAFFIQAPDTEQRPPLITGQTAPAPITMPSEPAKPSPHASPATNTVGLPALPLEAVLLDRKRRLVGTAGGAPSTASLGGAGASTPPAVDVSMAPSRNINATKGTRFKSSPLIEGEVMGEKAKEGEGVGNELKEE